MIVCIDSHNILWVTMKLKRGKKKNHVITPGKLFAAVLSLGISELKPEQKRAIDAFVSCCTVKGLKSVCVW